MSETLQSDLTSQSESNEFDYRPLSPLGPIAFLLGLAALVAFLGFYGIFVAVIALIVATIATRSIKKSDGEVGGLLLARVGMWLALVSVIGGVLLFNYHLTTECPEGYERVNFPRQIAAKMFQLSPQGERIIPEDVQPLLDKKIFLKGYMYITKSNQNRRDFVILKDSGDCCFGGDPKAYDMIQVTLRDDLEAVNFPAFSMVSVAGVLRADPYAPKGLAVYTMEAHLCESARTPF